MPFLDYNLPPELVAQTPAAQRDESRLMVLDRTTGGLAHLQFRDLPDLLRPGDLLVLNDTRVLPARLLGRRAGSGGRWEGLFLGERTGGLWEMMCQTRRTPKPGDFIDVTPGPLRLELVERLADGNWLVRPHPPGAPTAILAQYGRMPIPRYIRKGEAEPQDAERYQTVFASRPGAIAAPTAGLHFTPAVFEQLKGQGISWCYVTLHVGVGTFAPIRVADVAQHVMHREWGELPAATAQAIDDCRSRGGRVVAVGTTTVRVLETVAADGPIRAWQGETGLFIHPPFQYRAVDALITNFHLPRSSLLLLVSAFAGEDKLRAAYAEAIARRYRFYSYGDAMMII